MSCVIGLLNEGKIYIASDGIATTEDGERRPIIATKIFRNGNYLIGFTGSIRTGQVLQPESFQPPKYIHELPDAIRNQFAEKGCLVIHNESQQHHHACNFVIGYEGRLYEILIDFQLNEIYGEFTAIGSGAGYALGSLYSTKKWTSPNKRLKTALKAAAEFDRSCGEPFYIEVI